MHRKRKKIQELLDSRVKRYNVPGFIELDPISLPHRFTTLQDIEIVGFLTATLAWGQRKTIINKMTELVSLMDEAPYDFILNHQEVDRKRLEHFKHRTFQPVDALYFVDFLQRYYRENHTMEDLFNKGDSVKSRLEYFHDQFFMSDDAPQRTRKHVATPYRKSTCKRLNMYLRWMVRKDDAGVDFGLWNTISMADLMMPLDVHVGRVARHLGLLGRKQNDWQAVEELTANLKKYDAHDPVKYDYALFGMGVEGEL